VATDLGLPQNIEVAIAIQVMLCAQRAAAVKSKARLGAVETRAVVSSLVTSRIGV
jgi:hypothetical protein